MHELIFGWKLVDYVAFHVEYDNNGIKGHSYVLQFANDRGAFVSTDYAHPDLWEIQMIKVQGYNPLHIEFEFSDDVITGGYTSGLNDDEIRDLLNRIRRMDPLCE